MNYCYPYDQSLLDQIMTHFLMNLIWFYNIGVFEYNLNTSQQDQKS